MSKPSDPLLGPTANLLRVQLEQDALYRDLCATPADTLASQIAQSYAQVAAREIAIANEPARLLASEAAAKMAGTIEPIQTTGAAFALINPPGIDRDVLDALAGVDLVRTNSLLSDALLGVKAGLTPELTTMLEEARKAFENIGVDHKTGIFSLIGEQQRLHESLFSGVVDPVAEFIRTNQWATTVGKIDLPDISKVFDGLPAAAAEVARLHESVAKTFTGSFAEEQARISSALGLGVELSGNLELTRFKMSAFAGLTEVMGTLTPAWDEAYRSLFGDWRTQPDLPDSFWRDPRVRRRMYHDAEVDPGLVGARLSSAVEVVVESGLTAGLRSEAKAVAIVSLGDISMTIRSNGARVDAFRVLERFEQELRAYITRKLSEKFGPDWFKLRVDGNVAGAAKEIRKSALQRGESPMPLIHYTELGQLESIIGARRNWDEVFGEVFINLAEFNVDMQKLVAARRPVMHSRPLDGVRLVELICVMQRLAQRMEDDGAWKIAAESEH